MNSAVKTHALQSACTELYKIALPTDLAKEIVDWGTWDPWFVPEHSHNRRWHTKYRKSAENPALIQCDPAVQPKAVLMLEFDAGDDYRVTLKMRRAQTAPGHTSAKNMIFGGLDGDVPYKSQYDLQFFLMAKHAIIALNESEVNNMVLSVSTRKTRSARFESIDSQGKTLATSTVELCPFNGSILVGLTCWGIKAVEIVDARIC